MMPPIIVPIPPELCGVRGCVFLETHEGKHSWEPAAGQLVAYLHSGFNIVVSGNVIGLDALKDLLIESREVKGIAIYKGEGNGPHLKKILQLNYTQIKERRKK